MLTSYVIPRTIAFMTFGQQLQALREAAELTQEALAKKSRIPLGSIRNYEQSHRLPTFPAIVALAAALGTDCTAFAACSDVRKSKSP